MKALWAPAAALGLFSAICLLIAPSASGQTIVTGVTVTGTVADDTGVKIAGISLRLFSTDQLFETRTGAAGKFAFSKIPAGTYELQTNAIGYKTTVVPLEIAANANPPISVTITPAPSDSFSDLEATYSPRPRQLALQGFVYDYTGSSAAAMPNAHVLISMLGGTETFRALTDARGSFQLSNLPPGKYTVAITDACRPESLKEPFWITQATLTTIKLQTYRLESCGQ